jgi:prepilin-type N-terminal cleavage/methylation domain-containing protein
MLMLEFLAFQIPRQRVSMATDREQGFTLIELLIVVAIIAVIATFAISGMKQATINGNETSALTSLTVTRNSQVAYYTSCGNGSYAASYTVLGTPPPGRRDPFISADLGHADPVLKAGYVFTLGAGQDSTAGPNDCNGTATVTTWLATAVPQAFGATGGRSFAIDDLGTVWQSKTAVAPTQPFTENATTSPVR